MSKDLKFINVQFHQNVGTIYFEQNKVCCLSPCLFILLNIRVQINQGQNFPIFVLN